MNRKNHLSDSMIEFNKILEKEENERIQSRNLRLANRSKKRLDNWINANEDNKAIAEMYAKGNDLPEWQMREQERFDSKIKGATYVLTSKNSKNKLPTAVTPNH